MTSSFSEEVCISDLTTDCRVLTEAQPPYRIVHVNAAWCQTTGYQSSELIGSTCKGLQGEATCQRTLQVLQNSLRQYRPITVRLLNYKADGSPFVNDLTVLPIVDRATNTTSHFLGVLRERPLPEPSWLPPLVTNSETNGVPQPTDASASASGGAAAASVGAANSLNGHREGTLGAQAQIGLGAEVATGSAPAAAAEAAQQPFGAPQLYVPTLLQEALQHDVSYPQLITERSPPYKTIHVNAAWCRQCGYRADDLIGRPYSMLLGPNPAASLVELLEHAFSSGRPLTCHAVYFTKSGLPWQAELTLSPLLDSSGDSSTYFVHLLRPSAETLSDAEPRVAGASSKAKRTSNGSGHSVITLTGLSSAVQAGHKGLAAYGRSSPPSIGASSAAGPSSGGKKRERANKESGGGVNEEVGAPESRGVGAAGGAAGGEGGTSERGGAPTAACAPGEILSTAPEALEADGDAPGSLDAAAAAPPSAALGDSAATHLGQGITAVDGSGERPPKAAKTNGKATLAPSATTLGGSSNGTVGHSCGGGSADSAGSASGGGAADASQLDPVLASTAVGGIVDKYSAVLGTGALAGGLEQGSLVQGLGLGGGNGSSPSMSGMSTLENASPCNDGSEAGSQELGEGSPNNDGEGSGCGDESSGSADGVPASLSSSLGTANPDHAEKQGSASGGGKSAALDRGAPKEPFAKAGGAATVTKREASASSSSASATAKAPPQPTTTLSAATQPSPSGSVLQPSAAMAASGRVETSSHHVTTETERQAAACNSALAAVKANLPLATAASLPAPPAGAAAAAAALATAFGGAPPSAALTGGVGPMAPGTEGLPGEGSLRDQLLLAQYIATAEAVAKMSAGGTTGAPGGLAGGVPGSLAGGLVGGVGGIGPFNPAAFGANGALPNAGLAAAAFAAATAGGLPSAGLHPSINGQNLAAASSVGWPGSLLSAISGGLTGMDPSSAAAAAAAATGGRSQPLQPPMVSAPPGAAAAAFGPIGKSLCGAAGGAAGSQLGQLCRPPNAMGVGTVGLVPSSGANDFAAAQALMNACAPAPATAATALYGARLGGTLPRAMATEPPNGLVSTGRVSSLSSLGVGGALGGGGMGGGGGSTNGSVSGAAAVASAGVRVPPFLTKLYTIMQDAQPEDYAGWCPDGQAFRITDPQRFADQCLPRFFKHNKLGSFQQQLLTYGFSRVPNESCLDISAIWKHPKFQAGHPELLELITRSTAKRDTKGEPGAAGKGGGVVDDGDEDDAEETLANMQTHLGNLTQSLAEMHSELRATRAHEMRVLEQLVARVDKRLKKKAPAAATATEATATGAAAPAGESSANAESNAEMAVATEKEQGAEGAAALASLGTV